MLRIVLLLLFTLSLGGCYYLQAAKGQLELTRKREPIADVLQDENTSPELADRLRLIQEAREFSIDALGLPDNDSYRTYADIVRDYVVWNVFAAPEFSLQPKTWCFPVAGCVGYRGYFAEEAARKEAARLEADGFDVVVGGVAAYSTLGKLKDPVVSSMMQWDDLQLVAVLFHELAHQVLYVKGDSGFNESFATAVEEIGMHRWLTARGAHGDIERYDSSRVLRQSLVGRVAAARADLTELYASAIPAEAMRRRKQARREVLAGDAGRLLENAGRDSSGWQAEALNNARLASIALYEGRVPEFRALLKRCNEQLECFYAAAKVLAGR